MIRAATPTMAKPEAGCAFFSYAVPVPAVSRGTWTEVISSSGASAVVNVSTKKSDACYRSLSGRTGEGEMRFERQQGRGIVGGRIGMRYTAPNRTDVAYLNVADATCGGSEERDNHGAPVR